MGIDQQGNPVIDPTANVLSLVEKEVTRLNDLAQEFSKRVEGIQTAHERRDDQAHKYERRLFKEIVKRVTSLQTLHVNYQEKLALAESKRIDAIRAVDVAAVAVASDRAVAQATVLSNQVAASAEALRLLVASTQSALATQALQTNTAFTERLAALEKAQYESKGKSGVTDPAMAELVSEMRTLMKVQSSTGGRSEGLGIAGQMILGVAAVAASVIAAVSFMSNGKTVQPTTAYVPAPVVQVAPNGAK